MFDYFLIYLVMPGPLRDLNLLVGPWCLGEGCFLNQGLLFLNGAGYLSLRSIAPSRKVSQQVHFARQMAQ